MLWFLRLLPGSVIYRRTHRTQGIVVFTADLFMIYYREGAKQNQPRERYMD